LNVLFDAIEQLLFEGAEARLGRSPLGKKVGIIGQLQPKVLFQVN